MLQSLKNVMELPTTAVVHASSPRLRAMLVSLPHLQTNKGCNFIYAGI